VGLRAYLDTKAIGKSFASARYGTQVVQSLVILYTDRAATKSVCEHLFVQCFWIRPVQSRHLDLSQRCLVIMVGQYQTPFSISCKHFLNS
jgi:hypothetical protein